MDVAVPVTVQVLEAIDGPFVEPIDLLEPVGWDGLGAVATCCQEHSRTNRHRRRGMHRPSLSHKLPLLRRVEDRDRLQ